MAPIGPDQFRHTMGHLPAGVTVLVVKDQAGAAHGMTASAVTSLSLEPPMILVCVDHTAAIHDLVISAATFGVNVLARDQDAVAIRFADRDRHAFGGGDDTSPAGLPLVRGALAHLDVRRAAVTAGGDHSIITGTVEWAEARDGAPLLYFRSHYTGLEA